MYHSGVIHGELTDGLFRSGIHQAKLAILARAECLHELVHVNSAWTRLRIHLLQAAGDSSAKAAGKGAQLPFFAPQSCMQDYNARLVPTGRLDQYSSLLKLSVSHQ